MVKFSWSYQIFRHFDTRDLYILQEDGDKKIDLAPGHLMEHDHDVYFALPNLLSVHLHACIV